MAFAASSPLQHGILFLTPATQIKGQYARAVHSVLSATWSRLYSCKQACMDGLYVLSMYGID